MQLSWYGEEERNQKGNRQTCYSIVNGLLLISTMS